MAFTVRLTDDAARDLTEIVDYVADHGGGAQARHVLDRIAEALGRLASSPQRGAYPKELLAVGIKEYRETFFKPYRLIHRIEEEEVFVLIIAEGRRDFRALLERRLLEV